MSSNYRYIGKDLYRNYTMVLEENEKLKKENAFLRRKIKTMEDDFSKTIAEMNRKMDALIEDNKRLKDEVSRLNGIIKNNSTNSSLPPSSDQKPSKAPNEYNSRKKTKRHPGGQVGHSGITLAPKEIERRISEGLLKREIITSPLLKLSDRIRKRYVKRYVIDLKIEPIVYEYHIPLSEAKAMAPVSYGSVTKAMAISLCVEHSVSIDRTASFLSSIAGNGFNVSHGWVDNLLSDFSDRSILEIGNISNHLLNAPILHTDATNVNLNGTQSYIRNQSTDDYVLYSSQEKKNIESLKQTGILKQFAGLLVADHETAIILHFGSDHAECNAHLMRYLTKATEEAKNSWASEMQSFLNGINEYRKLKISIRETSFSPEELERYSKRYDEIVEKGYEQNKYTERRFAKRYEKTLLTRLRTYKDNHILFMRDFSVPFTNNMSERDLRKCKNKQKISGGFRSKRGKERYCNIMSIIESCKRQGINPFFGIQKVFAGERLFG